MTLERLPNIADNVKPLRSEVTNEECLNILVEIYAGCLHGKITQIHVAILQYYVYTHVMFNNGPIYPISFAENLVPNLMIELYFIIQLLTVRGGDFESLADVSPGSISLAKHLVTRFTLQPLDDESSYPTVYFKISF